MRLSRRVGVVAAATGCPGHGVVNRLGVEDAPDLSPRPACGGIYVRVIEEVVVGPSDATPPCHVRDRT